jgi:EAL domain-containing protein (putative c-di-GMP-specific phosphodiesterase class I)/GGDEF domain-containing protein
MTASLMSPVFEWLPDLIVLVRRDGVLLGFAGGRGVAPLQPAAPSIGKPLDSVWPDGVASVVRQLIRQAISSRTTHDVTFRDGERAYEARACPVGPDRAICVIRQPSVQAADEAGATGIFGAFAAHFDRRSFLRRLQGSLSMATLQERPAAVGVIYVEGLTDLTRITDSLVAEQAMSAAVRRLAELPAATHGGPEPPWYAGQLTENQIVLVVESRDRDRVEALIERHCSLLREPIRIGDAEFHLTPYAGVAILGPDAASPRRLLQHARGAAAEARRSGTGRPCFFSDTVRLRSLARMDVARELREAIDRRSIKLSYMARRDLESGALAAAVGYMRWPHELRGDVPPAEFLAIAEAGGLASALSRSALQCIGADFRRLQSQAPADLRVSFGPLRQHILDEGFLSDVEELLAAGVPAERLELRFGERSLFACDTSLLDALASLGVKLIADEVGRGISSIDVLARAPLAGLQLDRSWIEGLPHDPMAMKICRAGFRLAEALGLTSIARGIDSAAQRDALLELGCRQGVGELFGILVPSGLEPEAQQQARG